MSKWKATHFKCDRNRVLGKENEQEIVAFFFFISDYCMLLSINANIHILYRFFRSSISIQPLANSENAVKRLLFGKLEATNARSISSKPNAKPKRMRFIVLCFCGFSIYSLIYHGIGYAMPCRYMEECLKNECK